MKQLNKDEEDASQTLEELQDLTLKLLSQVKTVKTLTTLNVIDIEKGINLDDRVRKFEIELITRALEVCGGRQNAAARLLGVKVTTFNAKVKRYSIEPQKTLVW